MKIKYATVLTFFASASALDTVNLGLTCGFTIFSKTNGPTNDPTSLPTPGPTSSPTPGPTPPPTLAPTPGPTSSPTPGPTSSPTPGPTPPPTLVPTPSPTLSPTRAPTSGPTSSPTPGPTPPPTLAPTPGPTSKPTSDPTPPPTLAPRSPEVYVTNIWCDEVEDAGWWEDDEIAIFVNDRRRWPKYSRDYEISDGESVTFNSADRNLVTEDLSSNPEYCLWDYDGSSKSDRIGCVTFTPADIGRSNNDCNTMNFKSLTIDKRWNGGGSNYRVRFVITCNHAS